MMPRESSSELVPDDQERTLDFTMSVVMIWWLVLAFVPVAAGFLSRSNLAISFSAVCIPAIGLATILGNVIAGEPKLGILCCLLGMISSARHVFSRTHATPPPIVLPLPSGPTPRLVETLVTENADELFVDEHGSDRPSNRNDAAQNEFELSQATAVLSPEVLSVLRKRCWLDPPAEGGDWESTSSQARLRAYSIAIIASLTAGQRTKLAQVKQRLEAELEGAKGDAAVNEAWLARFLRGKGWNVEHAENQARESLRWRRAKRAHTRPREKLLLAHWPELATEEDRNDSAAVGIARCWPCGWHGCDREGRPVYIDRMVGMSARTMQKADPDNWVQRLVDLSMAESEFGLVQRVVHSELTDASPPFEHHTVVVDCAGLTMSIRKSVGAFRAIASTAAENYPDSVHRLLIVNAPRIFASLFGLVSRFIDPNTRAKLQIIGVGKLRTLHALVPPEALPPDLGGCCKCQLCSS
jgi:hypothetical protein